jgi:hypothetical protein
VEECPEQLPKMWVGCSGHSSTLVAWRYTSPVSAPSLQ